MGEKRKTDELTLTSWTHNTDTPFQNAIILSKVLPLRLLGKDSLKKNINTSQYTRAFDDNICSFHVAHILLIFLLIILTNSIPQHCSGS